MKVVLLRQENRTSRVEATRTSLCSGSSFSPQPSSFILAVGGFTLLELLIAMTMTVILAGAIASAFGAGLRAWKTVEGQSDVHQENAAVGDLLASDLRSAWLSTDGTMGSFELSEGVGQGSNAELIFTSLLPDKENPQVCYLATVTYRFDSTNGKLWRSVSLVEPEAQEGTASLGSRLAASNSLAGGSENQSEESIAEHVSGFAIRCWDGEAWQGSWTTSTDETTITVGGTQQTQTTVAPDLGGVDAGSQPEDEVETPPMLPRAVEVTVTFEATLDQPEHAVRTIALIPMGHLQ